MVSGVRCSGAQVSEVRRQMTEDRGQMTEFGNFQIIRCHSSSTDYLQPWTSYDIVYYKNVGRASVPADTGRHGGRPYASLWLKFLFRSDWTLAARGGARMKLQLKANRRTAEPQNDRRVESLRASPSATTRQAAQSFFNRPFDTEAHHRQNALSDVGRSVFDVHQFFFDLTGRSAPKTLTPDT